MTTRTMAAAQRERGGRDAKQLFVVMKVAAWVALVAGLALCMWDLGSFNDANLSLMAGTGCLVGSVFIYTIGTIIHLMHKRQMQMDISQGKE